LKAKELKMMSVGFRSEHFGGCLPCAFSGRSFGFIWFKAKVLCNPFKDAV